MKHADVDKTSHHKCVLLRFQFKGKNKHKNNKKNTLLFEIPVYIRHILFVHFMQKTHKNKVVLLEPLK
jgi:hypothetical protein